MSTFDLVIVGGGPTALRALADLEISLMASREVSATPRYSSRPRILVLEPSTPGAGTVWDPSQPDHLILNADARIIDMRCPSVPATFVEYSGTDAPFPPRARIGAYLAWCFERLRSSPLWDLRHVSATATAVTRNAQNNGYSIALDTGASAEAYEVLMATGHAPGTLPDHRALSDDSDSREVLLRGASLTAFDIVADLTMGRGGTYVHNETGELRYSPSGREPQRITLWSRSGESMLPKPQYSTAAENEALRTHTRALRERTTPDLRWWLQLCRAAQAAAASHGIAIQESTLMNIWNRRPAATGNISTATARRWSEDLARAAGDVDSDPRWWWGRAWAGGYEDIISSLDRSPRRQKEWAPFQRRAARMERWAFGPPSSTIERLLALTRTGLLVSHCSHLHPAADGTQRLHAVTPGPGVLRQPLPWDRKGPTHRTEPNSFNAAHSPLWSALLHTGEVLVRPGESGVFTDPEGCCLRSDGTPSPGLSALGRPTTGPTLGHDSLQRQLRPEFRAWALAFLRRCELRTCIHPTHGAAT